MTRGGIAWDGAGAVPSDQAGATRPATRAVPLWRRYPNDVVPLLVLTAATVATALVGLRDLLSFFRGDWITFFMPFYGFLGEQLRGGTLPGWNPHLFAGAPFLADPESGWAYLPVMALFALFSIDKALVGFVVVHCLLAAFGAYVLARLLGLAPAGAVVAGAAYVFPWFLPATGQVPVFVELAAWLPWVLIGTERSLRAAAARDRLVGWALAAFAISQIASGWVGQGTIYGVAAFVAFLAYRTLVVPPRAGERFVLRVTSFVMSGLVVGGAGVGLAAWGLLPRLDANRRSNLALGSYSFETAWSLRQDGFSLTEAVTQIVGGYAGGVWWYAGGAAIALALIGLVAARRWAFTPFFGLWLVVVAVLVSDRTTPLHTLLYRTVPLFERFHAHDPARATVLIYLPIALLAGAAVGRLLSGERPSVPLRVVALLPAVAALATNLFPASQGILSWPTQAAIVAACLLAALVPGRTLAPVGAVLPFAFVAVLWWDATGRAATLGYSGDALVDRVMPISAEALLTPSGAAKELQDRRWPPSRYFGFAPSYLPEYTANVDRPPRFGYRRDLREAPTYRILVNNRGMLFGLEDMQGYSPIQIDRMSKLVDALNGHRQEYHEALVYKDGIDSPLLDLLNVRYVVVGADDRDLPQAVKDLPTAWKDRSAKILERPTALPRAWLAPEMRVMPGEDALAALAAGDVDPRQTALVEAGDPIAPAGDASGEGAEVEVTSWSANAMTLRGGGPGMLVVSAAWDPGWRATVDGVPAPVERVDWALQGVRLAGPAEAIVLTYEPPLLRLGLAISAATAAALVLGWLAAKPRPVPAPTSVAESGRPRWRP